MVGYSYQGTSLLEQAGLAVAVPERLAQAEVRMAGFSLPLDPVLESSARFSKGDNGARWLTLMYI